MNLNLRTLGQLFDSLELLKIVVPTVTDQVLQIIDFLIKPENEKPSRHERTIHGMPTTREYPEILQQCLTILESPSLRYFNFDSCFGEASLNIYFLSSLDK